MKLIKYYSIAVGFIALINLGFYASNNKPISFGTKIAAKEKWENILIGKWEFSIMEKGITEIYNYEGEIEYYEDGTFKRYVTLKTLYSEEPFDENEKISFDPYSIDLIMSGIVTGTWEVSDGQYWKEKIETCNMVPTYCSYDCQERYDTPLDGVPNFRCIDFYPETTMTFGEVEMDEEKKELKQFSKRKISIEGRTITNACKLYSFTKKS